MNTLAPPASEEPIATVPAEVAQRIGQYIEAAKIAASTDFPGLVLMSLSYLVDDETWEEALQDALMTIADMGGIKGRKKAGSA